MQAADEDEADDSPCPDVLANPDSALAKLLGAGGEEAERIKSELVAFQRQVELRLAKTTAAAEAKRRKLPVNQ